MSRILGCALVYCLAFPGVALAQATSGFSITPDGGVSSWGPSGGYSVTPDGGYSTWSGPAVVVAPDGGVVVLPLPVPADPSLPLEPLDGQ